jgi:RsiW-degrading membrane proteinase PrsW (M82 family)
VIEGRPSGRPGAGVVIGVVAGLACAGVALGVDLLESLDSSGHSPVPFLIALPLALIPVPFLIAVVLLLDRLEPEPGANLVFAFAWGAGIAALLAAVINTAGLIFITQPALGKTTGEFVSATFGAPLVEESLKGSVLLWLLWRRRQEFDGPTDGIIYAAMVGLGFAMMENVGYYISALARPAVGGVPLLGATFVFRGVLAPFAHPAFTSMTGMGVAYAATHRRGGWAVWLGLLGAMTLHGLWNGLTTFGLAGLVLAYGLLACVLVVLVAVVVTDRRRIVRLIRRFLPAYQGDGLVTAADLRMLCTLRERRAARAWAGEQGGRTAAKAMSTYQLAATELALAHLRAERGTATPAEARARIQALAQVMASARQALGRYYGGAPRHGPAPAPGYPDGGYTGGGHPPDSPSYQPGGHQPGRHRSGGPPPDPYPPGRYPPGS